MSFKIFSFSLRRSGHNAILNWLARQCKSDIDIFNDCKWLDGKIQMFGYIKDGKLSKYGNKDKYIVNQNDISNPNFILSFEERHDRNLMAEDWIDNITNQFELFDVLFVIRNPYNMMSSRWSKNIRKNPSDKKVIDIWKTHIRMYLDNPYKYSSISYDLWVSDKRYREFICHYYDIKFTDLGFNDILSKSNFGNSQFLNRSTNYSNSDFERILDEEVDKLFKEYIDIERVRT